MTRGWCPFARHLPRTTFGYPRGAAGQNRPRAFVVHVMSGYKRTMDEGDWMERTGVGVTAAVGKDGSLSQYTSIFDAHWGNGVVNRPNLANAFVAEMRRLTVSVAPVAGGEAWLDGRGANVFNAYSISLEHEGFSGEPFTDAMVETAVRFLRWCNEELIREGYPPIPGDEGRVIGHCEIDGVNRAGCPGTGWPKARYLDALRASEPRTQNQEPAGGRDGMIRHVRPNVNWPSPPGGAVGLGVYTIRADRDFALPEGARSLLIEVRAEGEGRVVVVDGGTPPERPLSGYAGSVRRGTAQVRVFLGPDATFHVLVEDGRVDRLWLTSVGYW